MHYVYVENVTKHKHKHWDHYTPLYYGTSITMTLTPYEDAKSLEVGPVVPTARITINHKSMCTFVCIFTHTHVHTRTHTLTHIYTHTYTYIY